MCKVTNFKMFNLVKQPRELTFLINFLMRVKNQRFLTAARPFVRNSSSAVRLSTAANNRSLLVGADQFRLILSRNKSKSSKRVKENDEDSSDEEDELEDEDEDDFDDNSKNVKTFNVNSLRIDTLLKTALGISRKKVEYYFYQNKIRVNEEFITKKSENASVGDEIDLIIGFAKNSSKHLNVNRIKILKIERNPDNGKKIVKVLREKSLIIQNYSSRNAWREPEEENL